MARRKNDGGIRVHVVDYGRAYLVMRYRDPVTGKHVCKSAETANRKEAEREAAKWEADLHEGRYKPPSKVTWAEFRQRYEDEVLPGLTENTFSKAAAAFNAVETHIDPARLETLTAEQLSRLQSKLRDAKLSESTIKGHLAHLLAALRWAKRVGMLREVPSVDMPRRAKGSKVMKGRPVTTEEFERMLSAVCKVVGDDKATIESWQRFLRGLWLSGLRLEESLALYWDRDDKLMVDLSGRYPMLRIPAELEKGHKDRLLPIAPEFAETLLATPEKDRRGPVFNPKAQRERSPRLGVGRIGKAISTIGEKANVKVSTDPRTGKVKYASAHDLRRSFGERWASRVMPQVLKELMRHESIETTLRYYVGRNAETTADVLYQAVANVSGSTSGNSGKPVLKKQQRKKPQTQQQ